MLSPCDTLMDSGVLSHCIQSAVIMLRNAIVTRCSVNRAINRESVAQMWLWSRKVILAKIPKHFCCYCNWIIFFKFLKLEVIKCCFFFHCQQWCVILYMFLMLTELSQNKVLQKEKQSAPVCFCLSLNIQCAFSRDFTEARIQSPLKSASSVYWSQTKSKQYHMIYSV